LYFIKKETGDEKEIENHPLFLSNKTGANIRDLSKGLCMGRSAVERVVKV